MVNRLKQFIHRILPSSKSQVNDRFDRLNQEININFEILLHEMKNIEEININFKTLFHEIKSIEEIVHLLQDQLDTIAQNMSNSTKTEIEKIRQEQSSSFQALEKQQLTTTSSTVTTLSGEIDKRFVILRNEILQTKRASKEAVWGEIFKDSIQGSSWLLHKRFYPGRWAVGYQFLYVLFRILSSNRPQNILELGLGQSTNLLTQYVDYYKNLQHRVIEHDQNWIDYYKTEFVLSDQTEIINLDIEKINFQEKYELFHYIDFCKYVSDRKYDLICIDAPFGGIDNVYSRIDVLDIIPECLSESFVIIIDDVNRIGEQNTIKIIEKKLESDSIDYCVGKYIGDKDTYVIVSEDNKFITSL